MNAPQNLTPTPIPEPTPLPDGTVLVPTTNGHPVTMDADVYNSLPEHHQRPFWTGDGDGRQYALVYRAPTRNGHQVHPCPIFTGERSGGRGNSTTLARVIMQAGAAQRVRYRNGDTSDLRSENLYLT